MFSQPWQITVYTKKSPEILHPPPPPPWEAAKLASALRKTTSSFPSFHVWNFSCICHASRSLYSVSCIYLLINLEHDVTDLAPVGKQTDGSENDGAISWKLGLNET